MRRVRRFALLSALLLLSCESHTVEQIEVKVPEGVKVPEEMIYIPAGEFIMGHAEDPATVGGKKVSTAAYLIDRFEVSRQDYHKHDPESTYHENTAKYPKTHVSYAEAEAYCRSLDKRLPTETEWEKAARGTDGRKWPWLIYFDHPNDGFSGFISEPVGKREEWISPYGVYGMGHNVWEWTSDWYHSPPVVEKQTFKTIRGGLHQTHLSIRFTPTYQRNYIEPESRFNFIGFRCAKDV